MGTGFESALLRLGSSASLANSDGLMSIKMLSKMLRADTQVAASLISSMSEMLPPAAGVGEVGGMLDVRG
ncbi:MAG: hypothetical protein LBC82_00870 [Oscillospiraceae bacterium]|nr:hypothetical protein [Oscillospiraceae bacterium]